MAKVFAMEGAPRYKKKKKVKKNRCGRIRFRENGMNRKKPSEKPLEVALEARIRAHIDAAARLQPCC
jgi:hypothetical protein